MRMLITGGAGFIGSNFVRAILKKEFLQVSNLTIIDKLTYAGNLANFSNEELKDFEFVHGDICEPELMEKLIPKADVVINFAAESHVDRSISNSKNFVTTNISGTHTILELIKKFDKRFIQISTDEVYGSIPHGSWSEESPLEPNSPYSATKASADLLALAFAKTYKLDICITRCSNNYGPNQYPEKAIPLFITNLLEGKKIPIYGKGENVRDWLHVSDHCFGIAKVIELGTSGNIYNIGGGTELTNLELANIILREMKRDMHSIEFVADRAGHDLRYSVDYSKLGEFGYKPKMSFQEGIRETIDWYTNNYDWWSVLKNING